MEEERRAMDSPSRSPPQEACWLRLHSLGRVRVEPSHRALAQWQSQHPTLLFPGEEYFSGRIEKEASGLGGSFSIISFC